VGVKTAESEPVAAAPGQYEQAIEHARKFARIMDRLIGIPGSEVGIGLDAIVGAIIPVGGDAIGGVAGLYVVLQAIRAKVPAIVIARMLLNIGLDALLGVVPVVGDIADVFFQSNKMNLRLLEHHAGGGKSTSTDWIIVGGAFGFVMLVFAIPLIFLSSIYWMLFHHR
jgi:hypothetical protein